MHPIGPARALGIACCLLFAGVASADTLTSDSYRLRAGTLGAAGGIEQASTAGTPSVGALHGIAGQSSSVGISVGSPSGTALEGGFYPAIRFAPEPGGPAPLLIGALALFGLRRCPATRAARRSHDRAG